MKCDRKWWKDGRELAVRTEDCAQHPEPRLRHIAVWMCEACIEGEGEECHTPGCVRPPAREIGSHPSFELLPEPAEVVQFIEPPAEWRNMFCSSCPNSIFAHVDPVFGRKLRP